MFLNQASGTPMDVDCNRETVSVVQSYSGRYGTVQSSGNIFLEKTKIAAAAFGAYQPQQQPQSQQSYGTPFDFGATQNGVFGNKSYNTNAGPVTSNGSVFDFGQPAAAAAAACVTNGNVMDAFQHNPFLGYAYSPNQFPKQFSLNRGGFGIEQNGFHELNRAFAASGNTCVPELMEID